MADERRWTGNMRGRFLLGERDGGPRVRALALAVGAVFVLGLGVGCTDPDAIGLSLFMPASSGETPDAGVIACPLPPQPLGNQALAPCKGRETEFSGGCWQAIDQRPPCDQDVLEHQGKCYVLVGKHPRLPRAVEPQEP